ncbi:MAG: hypothetical protein AAFX02_00850 [Pseudomonadota bacterium]
MKPIYAILAGAAIPSTFILGWMLLDTACTPEATALAGESVRECYRNWVGSSSGWAAAIVGGITVLVLLFQIRKAEQTAHRRQEEARAVFDAELSETLQVINEIWKHAEDISQLNIDDQKVDRYVELMKARLASVRATIEEDRLKNPCALMHPLDANKCSKLVTKVVDATKPVKLPVADPRQDRVHLIEVTGMDYFQTLSITFLIMTHRLETISEKLSTIFSNRNTKGSDEILSSSRQDFRELYFRDFLEVPSNPY